ncbi:hypothetical protein [Acanthopleuribacter pedis]|uniref:Uncharacterized protein n=1 Tax=Acanthopleuribacter pedis TaxID=442870 RepID=A0A8J7QIN5_9BACT|nr:hypothetical protein [Acanthopleuribacter pedis]MBO1321461.1 hypothetical protein [Acanthopleuribacter pedis]
MVKTTIEMGRQANSPVLSKPGLALVLPNNPYRMRGGGKPMVYACLREPKQNTGPDQRRLLDGLFVHTVEVHTQTPLSFHLFAKKRVFDDDITDFGDDWCAWFHFDLAALLLVAAPQYGFMLHASSRQFVSNALYVRFER